MKNLYAALFCGCLLVLPAAASDNQPVTVYLYSRTSYSAYSALLFSSRLAPGLNYELFSEWENKPDSILRINGRLKQRIWYLTAAAGLDGLIQPGQNAALGLHFGGLFEQELTNWLTANASVFTSLFPDDYTLDVSLGGTLKLAARIPFGLRISTLSKQLSLYGGVAKEW